MAQAGFFCTGGVETHGRPFLAASLQALDDPEGARVPAVLPRVFDAHVHVFPDRVFDAMWRWFGDHAWPVRYQLYSEQVLEFLFSRGVDRVVALHYAHKPGMAPALNRYVSELAAKEPRVTGLATVFPGEPGAGQILRDAFASGLRGVKMHTHVNGIAIDAPEMVGVLEACADADLPLVIHAGREPSSPAYPVDTHELCHVSRVERVLQRYPSLRISVPHLGADEFDGYRRLLERHDNLWLDTTMLLADFFPLATPWDLVTSRPDRIMYGSDFPNLPFAWDRELNSLVAHGKQHNVPPDTLNALAHDTAAAFFGDS